jgi:hypothetical protein
MVAAGFGIAWALWGPSGLSGGTAAAIRVAGLVIGALILLGAALLRLRAWRAAPGAARRGGFAAGGWTVMAARAGPGE